MELTPNRAIIENSKIWPQGSTGDIVITFNNSTENYSITGYTDNYPEEDVKNGTMNFKYLMVPKEGFVYKTVYYSPMSYFIHGISKVESTTLDNSGGIVRRLFSKALGMNYEFINFTSGDNPVRINYKNLYESYTPANTSCKCKLPETIDNTSMPRCICDCGNNCEYDEKRIKYIYDELVKPITESKYKSTFDEDSIMNFKLSNYYVRGCEHITGDCDLNYTKQNNSFSDDDIKILKMAYPSSSKNKPEISVKFIGGNEYQKAWIERTVKYTIEPLVGVKFIFPDNAINDNYYESSFLTFVYLMCTFVLLTAIYIRVFHQHYGPKIMALFRKTY